MSHLGHRRSDKAETLVTIDEMTFQREVREESGSFRSYSRSVRSFRPESFRPDFWGESFRPSWGGSFRSYFLDGSKIGGPIFGMSRFGLVYLYWEKQVR